MLPSRIVSLVPSLTELVCWLGRGEAVVGRTRFCDAPADLAARVPAIGGTKDPDLARIIALTPDLVLANREENRREDVDALQSAGLNVLVTDPGTVAEVLAMVSEIGENLGCGARAEELVAETKRALSQPAPARRPRVFVAVWKKPLLGLGSNTYGHDLIERAGGKNVLGDLVRYPEVPLAEVARRDPDLILLPDEPYHFGELDTVEYACVAPARVIDGRLLWWYGPRMPAAIRALRSIFMEV